MQLTTRVVLSAVLLALSSSLAVAQDVRTDTLAPVMPPSSTFPVSPMPTESLTLQTTPPTPGPTATAGDTTVLIGTGSETTDVASATSTPESALAPAAMGSANGFMGLAVGVLAGAAML